MAVRRLLRSASVACSQSRGRSCNSYPAASAVLCESAHHPHHMRPRNFLPASIGIPKSAEPGQGAGPRPGRPWCSGTLSQTPSKMNSLGHLLHRTFQSIAYLLSKFQLFDIHFVQVNFQRVRQLYLLPIIGLVNLVEHWPGGPLKKTPESALMVATWNTAQKAGLGWMTTTALASTWIPQDWPKFPSVPLR